jgi:hypothetical protein
MTKTMPDVRPERPHFSSGPCAKPPGWSASTLSVDSLGRSHRSKLGKARLKRCIDLMRANLQLPDTHRIGIVPGSDTGAFEMAMWTMLGARGGPMAWWNAATCRSWRHSDRLSSQRARAALGRRGPSLLWARDGRRATFIIALQQMQDSRFRRKNRVNPRLSLNPNQVKNSFHRKVRTVRPPIRN